MAANKDWSDLSVEDLQDLMTRPLSKAELAEYQQALGSEEFQEMVRRYHADAALSGVRTVVLGYFKHGISLEAMVTALANIWLDCFSRIQPRLDAGTEQSWRQMPQLLVQILLQQSLDVMNENREQLKTTYPPEFREMHAEWREHMPAALEPITDEAELSSKLEAQQQQVMVMYETLTDFRLKLEDSELQLDGSDYLEIWSLVMLQTYIFAQEAQEELYFLIHTNWHLFLARLSEIVTMMVLLRGSEILLLPENRAMLAELIDSGDLDNRL